MALPRFLTELKRRNVYRAALVYAGVSWVLLEFADVAFPRLGLPDWTVNFVLALALFGFPFAIVFAWIFDLSEQGIERTEPISPEAHHRFSITSIVEFVLICVLVVTVGNLYVDRLSFEKRLVEHESAESQKPGAGQPTAPNTEQYRAIAVLPFADMSESGDQNWFAEGVAEELLHALASVQGLKVAARTSSFAFKNTDKSIAEIAEILGVQAVLEGSVRRFGDRVRVTAQLIDTSNGYHIWSESYERQIDDIFKLQDELAKSIVNTLRLELGIEYAEVLVEEQTRYPAAYNAFIRGRALLDWASPKELNESIEYLEQAVTFDPLYPKAWGYLAFARAMSALWESTSEVIGPATVAYETALELDANQSMALAAKAWLTLILHRDWEKAGILYQRAIAAEDRFFAMSMYPIFFLGSIDKIPRAIAMLKEIEQIDPLHPGHKSNLAFLHIWSGDAQAAIQKAQEALQIKPHHAFALMALLEGYTANGNCKAVFDLVDRLPDTLQQEPRISGRAAVCHALEGREAEAREIYKHVMDTTPWYHANMQAAVLAMSLGEVETALDVLESEVKKHAWTSIFIRVYFRHDPSINKHPRYLALLQRMGLDDESINQLHEKFLL
jgi:TolB-like protein